MYPGTPESSQPLTPPPQGVDLVSPQGWSPLRRRLGSPLKAVVLDLSLSRHH